MRPQLLQVALFWWCSLPWCYNASLTEEQRVAQRFASKSRSNREDKTGGRITKKPGLATVLRMAVYLWGGSSPLLALHGTGLETLVFLLEGCETELTAVSKALGHFLLEDT